MSDFHLNIKNAWRMTLKNHSKRFSLFFRPGWNLIKKHQKQLIIWLIIKLLEELQKSQKLHHQIVKRIKNEHEKKKKPRERCISSEKRQRTIDDLKKKHVRQQTKTIIFWYSFKCICSGLFRIIKKFLAVVTTQVFTYIFTDIFTHIFSKRQKSTTLYKFLISMLNWIVIVKLIIFCTLMNN